MNDIVTAKSALPAMASLTTGLADFANEIKTNQTFMKFAKGEWVFGSDDTEVEEGSQWAVNPLTMEKGWIMWHPDENKKKVLAQHMFAFNEQRPPKSSLPDPVLEDDDKLGEWSEAFAVQLMCISGEDEGTETVFQTFSAGGKSLFSDFVRKLQAQLQQDQEKFVAVVELKSDSYKHKTYGKVFTPEFDIKKWVPLTDAMPVADEEVDEAEAKDEPETEVAEEAAPRRRRRR